MDQQNQNPIPAQDNQPKTIGIGQTPFTSEQTEFLGNLIKQYGHQIVDLAAGEVDAAKPIEKCNAVLGNVETGLLQAAKLLQWLQVAPAGVEKYTAPGVLPHEDVVLTNGSGAYGIAIAEYMLGGLLMIQRRMAQYLDNQKRHEWKQYPGITTLYGSHVTVVGIGDLGTNFAERCKAMGAKVTGVRKSADKDAPACYDRVLLVDALDDALQDADVVALCLPATDDTQKLIDADRFSKMKRGAILINVGRGTAVDTDALVAALQSGQLGGALIDVCDPEPLPADHPLWDAPNAVVTPHISGLDRDRLAAGRVFDIFKENLENFLTGKALNNVVDVKKGY